MSNREYFSGIEPKVGWMNILSFAASYFMFGSFLYGVAGMLVSLFRGHNPFRLFDYTYFKKNAAQDPKQWAKPEIETNPFLFSSGVHKILNPETPSVSKKKFSKKNRSMGRGTWEGRWESFKNSSVPVMLKQWSPISYTKEKGLKVGWESLGFTLGYRNRYHIELRFVFKLLLQTSLPIIGCLLFLLNLNSPIFRILSLCSLLMTFERLRGDLLNISLAVPKPEEQQLGFYSLVLVPQLLLMQYAVLPYLISSTYQANLWVKALVALMREVRGYLPLTIAAIPVATAFDYCSRDYDRKHIIHWQKFGHTKPKRAKDPLPPVKTC